MSLFQYIKDTRGELRHVAWPTQTQTLIYTALVIAISVFAAAYLGLFDFLFTSGIETALGIVPADVSQQPIDVNTAPSVLQTPEITIVPEGSAAPDAPVLQIVPGE